MHTYSEVGSRGLTLTCWGSEGFSSSSSSAAALALASASLRLLLMCAKLGRNAYASSRGVNTALSPLQGTSLLHEHEHRMKDQHPERLHRLRRNDHCKKGRAEGHAIYVPDQVEHQHFTCVSRYHPWCSSTYELNMMQVSNQAEVLEQAMRICFWGGVCSQSPDRQHCMSCPHVHECRVKLD